MEHAQLANIADSEHYDVVIIGGGINGIGTYREMALQGLKVLLVEKQDFCSGASSAPSRMIHGGLRYLENAEFDLVRESLAERNSLLKNAPHLVKPLRTIVPVNKHFAGVFTAGLRFFGLNPSTTERGSFIVKIGLMFYDVFTRNDRVLPTHRFYNKADTRRLFPSMRNTVKRTAEYYDAWITSPERLAMELIAEGNKVQGVCRTLNHCEVAFAGQGQLTVTSQLTNECRTVSAQVVINATGAWIDEVNEKIGFRSSFITGTKGSHIVVDNKALHDELGGSMIYYENAENRVCILFPYMGKVLIGSTDLPVKDLSNVNCTEDEVDYILESLKTILPGVTINKKQIVYKFSGVRPLGSASTETAGQIPRSHQLQVTQVSGYPVLSLVGGKWTTFRAFAEQATDKTLQLLQRDRQCSTRDKAIGGGRNYPATEQQRESYFNELRERYLAVVSQTRILFQRYGTDLEAILEFASAGRLTPLNSNDDYYVEELRYLIDREFALHLEDLVVRRTNLAIEGRLNNSALIEVALVMKAQLGWSDDTFKKQLVQCAERLQQNNGCQLDPQLIMSHYKKMTLTGESLCS